MITKFRLLGQPFNPVNRSEIVLECNHDQESVIDNPKPHVGVKNLYLVREDIEKIMTYLENPPGITEGAPFQIDITEKGVTETLEMYFNLMDGFKRSDDGIEATVTMRDSLDDLNNRVDGFTLESMYNETGVVPFTVDGIPYISYQQYFDKRVIFIPYVLSTVPNGRDAFMALFSITYIIIEISKAIKTLMQWSTPIAGIGVVLGIGQLVFEIIFLALLLASLLALMIHLFDCLIQHLKYHGAMLLIDMLKIVSVKLGLNFQSSTWNIFPFNQIAYLPQKFNPLEEQNPAKNTLFAGSMFGGGVTFGGFAKKGFHSPGYATNATHDSGTMGIQKGYFDGTGGDIFRFVKRICNGKIILPNNTNDLLLERRDFYPAATPYQLPDIRQDWNGYNTDELVANILIRFADDLNDKNSIDFINKFGDSFYTGTIFQATHSQIMTVNQRLVLLKGLREILIYASRGVAKDKLNLIENIHKDLYVAFHAIANAGILAVNALILVVNGLIVILDALITVFNIIVDVLILVVKIIEDIIGAISALFGGSFTPPAIKWVPLNNNWVHFIAPIPFLSTNPNSYLDRIDALLLENDIVSTPKILLVDTSRTDFTALGGYSGQKRIAYLHKDNADIINAGYFWNKFYSIDGFVDNPPDAFTGAPLAIKGNRFTKIDPATNKPGDSNPVILTLADFKNIVSNPKIKDNFAEEVIADSTQWRIGDESGKAEFAMRKQGWLANPQSNDGAKRAKEININLKIKTSLPNGR